ncbi:hypothetical protein EYF80_017185 [Liparis tanakae]|uniref:Uncharacterized protein n=1 Tax=Liparis tanakae TaxID=230148 RepID=A0A4Z2I3R2_9TELE|nr:hypothetical protein EYF80_017185 [Liparis tanakae]
MMPSSDVFCKADAGLHCAAARYITHHQTQLQRRGNQLSSTRRTQPLLEEDGTPAVPLFSLGLRNTRKKKVSVCLQAGAGPTLRIVGGGRGGQRVERARGDGTGSERQSNPRLATKTSVPRQTDEEAAAQPGPRHSGIGSEICLLALLWCGSIRAAAAFAKWFPIPLWELFLKRDIGEAHDGSSN